MKKVLAAFMLLGSVMSAMAQDTPVKVRLEAEAGAIKIMLHTYRVGDTGTTFDFVENGGQELLFPFQRLTASLGFLERHEVRFLYQPLELNTEITARAPFTIDGVNFIADEPVDITYSFPFYRFTYLYDFLPGAAELSAGAALQFRNASIRFTSVDGSKRAVSQNLGLVPALAVAGKFPFGDGLFLAFEATGLYASSAFINGADFEFEGSILDASIRAGARLGNRMEAFVNYRFLGGSASGVSQYPNIYWTQSTEKSTANYLATTSLTLGATLEL
ncbi:MAG: hypothetical protein E4H20_12115 [Spirochaetales bacterium]|nr:MAG: hypothetical protein E4H20_12115 [Spirochaetales bacterium]